MISIDWGTKVINIPKSDLSNLGGNIYEINVDSFRRTLKDLEDDENGIIFPKTHNHNTEVVLSGITYARVIEIINGYTITFEDGQYAVNIVGANSNIADVVNVNQVSIRISNSSGLIVAGSGVMPSDVVDIKNAIWNDLKTEHTTPNSLGKIVQDLEVLAKQIKALTITNI